MSTLHHLLPGWLSARHLPHDAEPSSGLASRIEVCPPELWPSSATLWGRARRWLARSAWTPESHRPVNRLALAKAEFRGSLADLYSPDALLLEERIERARSLRELWHLRAPLYGLLAMAVNQLEAEQRMAVLNRHFPTRAPRSGLVPLDA